MRIRVVRVCGVRARKSCVSAAVYFAAEFVRRGVRRDDVVKDIIFIASRGVEFFFFVGGVGGEFIGSSHVFAWSTKEIKTVLINVVPSNYVTNSYDDNIMITIIIIECRVFYMNGDVFDEE